MIESPWLGLFVVFGGPFFLVLCLVVSETFLWWRERRSHKREERQETRAEVLKRWEI